MIIRVQPVSSTGDYFFHVIQCHLIFSLITMEQNNFGTKQLGSIPANASLLCSTALGQILSHFVIQVTHHKLINFFTGSFGNAIHFTGCQIMFDKRELLIPHKQMVIENGTVKARFGRNGIDKVCIEVAPGQFVNQQIGSNDPIEQAEIPLIPPRTIAPCTETRSRVIGKSIPFRLVRSLTDTTAGFGLITQQRRVRPNLRHTGLHFIHHGIQALHHIVFRLIEFGFRHLSSRIHFQKI